MSSDRQLNEILGGQNDQLKNRILDVQGLPIANHQVPSVSTSAVLAESVCKLTTYFRSHIFLYSTKNFWTSYNFDFSHARRNSYMQRA